MMAEDMGSVVVVGGVGELGEKGVMMECRNG